MAEDPGKETRLIEVKGRQIVVRQLNEAQIMLMAREARTVGKADVSGAQKMVSAGRIMDILESAVVQQEDKDYLMELTIVGDLEMADLTQVVTVFGEEQVKPRVRRGAARR